MVKINSVSGRKGEEKLKTDGREHRVEIKDFENKNRSRTDYHIVQNRNEGARGRSFESSDKFFEIREKLYWNIGRATWKSSLHFWYDVEIICILGSSLCERN
jgi:hypothetical protein